MDSNKRRIVLNFKSRDFKIWDWEERRTFPEFDTVDIAVIRFSAYEAPRVALIEFPLSNI